MALVFGLAFFKDHTMFISKAEKSQIFAEITLLRAQVADLTAKFSGLGKTPSATGWTEEARARHSIRMKKMWEGRKAAKAAA